MIVCSRCGYKMEDNTLEECPLCRTPLSAANAQPQQNTAPQAQSLSPQSSGIPGVMPMASSEQPSGIPGVPPMAMPQTQPPQSSGIPGVPPAGGNQPQTPPASPLLTPGARVSLTGEVYEPNAAQAPPPSYVGGGMPPRPGAPSGVRPGGPYRREAAPAKSGSSGAIVAILLILVLVGGGFGGYWYWMHRTNPTEQTQKFLDALKVADFKTMYEYIDRGDETMTADQFEAEAKSELNGKLPGMIDMLKEFQKNLVYKAGEPTINGDTATVPITVTGSLSLTLRGQTLNIPVNTTNTATLKNHMGIWRLTDNGNPYSKGGFSSLGGFSGNPLKQ